MPYVERDNGTIIAVYNRKQPERAEEWLPEDDPDLVEFYNPPEDSTAFEVATDKTTIVANGEDTATITASIPVRMGDSVYVLVNGPPALKEPVGEDRMVAVEVAAEDVGPIAIEIVAGGEREILIIEAVSE